MNAFDQLSRRLLGAFNPASYYAAYDVYIQKVIRSPLWAENRMVGIRIPWRLGAKAKKCPSFSEAFQSRGLFLFGGTSGIPFYFGKTEQPLWKRLSGRFIGGGEWSQCRLAEKHQVDLITCGIDGFPHRNYQDTMRGG